MKPLTIPLMMALLKSTNPYEIERPCYMLWLHILALRSNFIEESDLWTTPELPLVIVERPGKPFDRSLYDDDDDDGRMEYSIDSRIDDSDFVPLPEDFSRSFFGDLSAIHESSTHELGTTGSEEDVSFTSIPEPLFPSVGVDDVGSQGAGCVPQKPSETPGPDLEVQQRVGPRRARIVDFAVKYLTPDFESNTTKVLHFYLHAFKTNKSPIIVEGKRAPPCVCTDDPEYFQAQLDLCMGFAYGDFLVKSPAVFQIYSCASFIAIAFSGPYWSFAICRPNSIIAFSQVISINSDAHDIALQTIFNAAETNPNNPGADMEMRRIAIQYSRERYPEVMF